MGRFSSKRAVVTGAASGIGAAIAEQLAQEGAHVIAADCVQAEASHTSVGKLVPYLLDVSSEDAWRELTAHLEETLGGLDLLVNCAGILLPGDIETTDWNSFQQSMAVNAGGVFLGCQQGVQRLLRHSADAAIVNVASTTALKPGSWVLAYGASKAAVLSMTRSVALHCAAAGYAIRCNAVLPAVVRTPMVERLLAAAPDPQAAEQDLLSQHPNGRLVSVTEVVDATLFLLSEAASGLTGAAIPVDGGLTAA
ncbi:MAG: SDR family NAD(P)-dependent oxidoreductase [Algiphilus sp.]